MPLLEIVVIKNKGNQIETGLKKVGAMLGDEVEVGCGSVLNPGTVIGKNSNIYPLSSVRGVIKANSIYKNKNVNLLSEDYLTTLGKLDNARGKKLERTLGLGK